MNTIESRQRHRHRSSRSFFPIAPLAFGLFLFLGASPIVRAGAAAEEVPRIVTVVGSGAIEVAPDVASVRIGVETAALSIDAALGENRRIMGSMVAAFVAMGIAEEDLQTANYGFSFDRTTPELSMSRSTQSTRYYRVNNMLTVIIRDLSATADIIDTAVVAGANQMWGVEFRISDPESIEREALDAASLDARERAAYLARLQGLALGEVVSVSELIGSSVGSLMLRSDGYGGSESTLNPGLLRFTSQLQVVYTLVPVSK